MDAFSIHVYGESPRIPPTLRHPRTTSIGIADYRQARRVCSERPSTGQRRPGRSSRSSTASTASRRPSRRRGARSTPGREVVPAVDAGDAGGATTARRSSSRGVSRRAHALLLPRRRRDAARGPAERGPLRRRDAEAEPRGGPARTRSLRRVSETTGAVHRLHLLPRRSRRGGGCRSRSGPRRRTRSPRSSTTSRRASTRCARTRRPACGPTPTSSSGRSPSATRISASSARRSTRRRSPAGSRRRTRTSRRRRRPSTRRRDAPGKIAPKGSPYLVVYPFVKVRPWYALPEADRQRAMDEHMRIGREEFPTIHNHTTYSFGIDDQEFMTAFECDEPADFMHLMLRLRDSEASRYTERDTPIFVGQHLSRSATRSPGSTGSARSSKTTVSAVISPRSCSSTSRPVPPCRPGERSGDTVLVASPGRRAGGSRRPAAVPRYALPNRIEAD